VVPVAIDCVSVLLSSSLMPPGWINTWLVLGQAVQGEGTARVCWAFCYVAKQ
jgi:hypothetical protein